MPDAIGVDFKIREYPPDVSPEYLCYSVPLTLDLTPLVNQDELYFTGAASPEQAATIADKNNFGAHT